QDPLRLDLCTRFVYRATLVSPLNKIPSSSPNEEKGRRGEEGRGDAVRRDGAFIPSQLRCRLIALSALPSLSLSLVPASPRPSSLRPPSLPLPIHQFFFTENL